MKNLLLFCIAVSLFACQPPAADCPEDTSKDALTGTWSMTALLASKTATGDTLWYGERTQYKMYANGAVMWMAESPMDSTEWYGYGTYSIDGDSLREVMLSGSSAFRKELEERGSNAFSHGLTVSEDAYSQTLQGNDSVTVREDYARVK